MSSGIPEDVERFIQAYIDSVEQLDVLLHLEKNNSSKLTATAIASALYSNAQAIEMRLRKLTADGLVSVSEDAERAYRYRPDSPVKDAMVKQLSRIYQERPVAVITAILSRRASSAQAFSDAFLFGKRGNL
jgi:predicted ArsR family transcriptional regulator